MCLPRWIGAAILVGALVPAMASAADATNDGARDTVRSLSERRDLRLSSDDGNDQTRSSFAPATSPASAPTARRNKPMDDQTLADGLLRAGTAGFRGQQQTANEMGLTTAQGERVKVLIQQRETAFREMLQKLRGGEIDRKEAISRAVVLANLSGELRSILDKDQFFSFQKRWFVENRAKAQADLIHRLISFLSVETSRLDLSPVQAEEAQELFLRVAGKYESLKLAYKIGDIDEPALRAAGATISEDLADGLKRILTEDQYRRLETAFLAWSRTPTSKPSL